MSDGKRGHFLAASIGDCGHTADVLRFPLNVACVMQALWCTVVSAAGDPPVARSDAAARAQVVRADATQLFKKKKYAEACDRFGQAAQLAPEDAALLTDLALCQHKLGHEQEATASNRRAIELASRDPASIANPEAAKVRRHAYFNLHQAGADADGPILGNLKGTRCGAIEAPSGCGRSFQACGYNANMGYRLRSYSRTTAKVALTPAGAAWTAGEMSDEATEEPDYASLSQAPAEKPQIVDDGFLIFISSFQDEAHVGGCEDMTAWTCAGSDAVQAAARACLKSDHTPQGAAATAPEETACFKKVCAKLEKNPSAAVAREKRRAEQNAAQCAASAISGTGASYSCGMVYANACTGLLAVVCSGSASAEDAPATRIDEYHFVTTGRAARAPNESKR
ncbi:MAG: hypothetical protein ABJA82_07855 [Myxococcales bacterium]